MNSETNEERVAQAMFAPERLPPRDESGFTMHPDVPEREEESWEATASACAALGWEADYVCGDELVDPNTLEYDVTTWNPEPPAGHQTRPWTLVAIYDSEDGPCAMFVRPQVSPAGVCA